MTLRIGEKRTVYYCPLHGLTETTEEYELVGGDFMPQPMSHHCPVLVRYDENCDAPLEGPFRVKVLNDA